ncbi:hypothetical protein HK101_010435, partial [Irineochytrium annulatum]
MEGQNQLEKSGAMDDEYGIYDGAVSGYDDNYGEAKYEENGNGNHEGENEVTLNGGDDNGNGADHTANDNDNNNDDGNGNGAAEGANANSTYSSVEDVVDFDFDPNSPLDAVPPVANNPLAPEPSESGGGSGGAPTPTTTRQIHSLPPHRNSASGQRALYVTDLAWWTTDEELRLIAADAGVGDLLGAKDIVFQEQKINGKSRGLAYLEFQTADAARAVKALMDKMEIHNKRPTVTLTYACDRKDLFKQWGGLDGTGRILGDGPEGIGGMAG